MSQHMTCFIFIWQVSQRGRKTLGNLFCQCSPARGVGELLVGAVIPSASTLPPLASVNEKGYLNSPDGLPSSEGAAPLTFVDNTGDSEQQVSGRHSKAHIPYEMLLCMCFSSPHLVTLSFPSFPNKFPPTL